MKFEQSWIQQDTVDLNQLVNHTSCLIPIYVYADSKPFSGGDKLLMELPQPSALAQMEDRTKPLLVL